MSTAKFHMAELIKEAVNGGLELTEREGEYYKKGGSLLFCGQDGEYTPIKRTARKLYQIAGKETVEKLGGNRYQICLEMLKRFCCDKDYVVVDGCRFLDEQDCYRKLQPLGIKTIVVKIVRKNSPSNKDVHPSEMEVLLIDEDYLIKMPEVANIRIAMLREAKKFIKYLGVV